MSQKYPFVSVVIPVFNDPTGMEKVLGALLNQTYPPSAFEVIVCDNGSTDSTTSVIETFIDRFAQLRLVFETETRGSYAARNKALDAATGDIVAFTDSDCVPQHQWIESGVEAIQRGAGMAAGHIQITVENGLNVWSFLDMARKLDQESYVKNASFGATANLFVKTTAIQAFGAFRDDLISGGDYEFGRRLVRNGCTLVYSRDAEICHPARDTYKEILKKTKRVAKGQRRLEELGLLEHGRMSLKRFPKPNLRLRTPEGIKVPAHTYLGALIMANVFRYINFFLRLR